MDSVKDALFNGASNVQLTIGIAQNIAVTSNVVNNIQKNQSLT